MDKVLDSAILSSANKRKGILAIGARPDDIELGCGASLARLAQKGIYIAAVVMTTGNSGTDGIIAVSYTHLDVYKRQVIS